MFICILSVIELTCGEQYVPTFSPIEPKSLEIKADVEPLPFVPVMNAWKVHLGTSDCLSQKAHVVKSSIIDLFLSERSIDVTTKEL